VELIISLIHLAVTLFLAGLIMLLYNLNTLVTCIFLIFSALAAMAYMFLSITPIVFDDAPFRTLLTPFLAGIHTFMSPLLAPAMHLWPSRSPRRQEIPAEVSLHSLQIHCVLDLSLRAVEENQELEDFAKTLPRLFREGNTNSRDFILYLRDQDLFGRLGQHLRLSYNNLRTSPDMNSNVACAMSCITMFCLLVERFMGPDASLFPSGSEIPTDSGVGHALNVLERLASSEDVSFSIQVSCTLLP
jgi:hypothetical protein